MGSHREDLAWAAGLWEGEGWFGSRYTISQVDRWPLDRFAEIIGFGRVHGPYDPPASKLAKTPNAKPFYVWRAGSIRDMDALAAMLWPWLSPRRRQAIEATRHPDRRLRTHCAYGHPLTQGKRQKVCLECKRIQGRVAYAAGKRYIRGMGRVGRRTITN